MQLGVVMDYRLIIKIAIVGILVSILNQILKQTGRDELAFLSSLAGLVLVLLWLLPHLTELFSTIDQLLHVLN
jgi:stage III sporulation protein AC